MFKDMKKKREEKRKDKQKSCDHDFQPMGFYDDRTESHIVYQCKHCKKQEIRESKY